MRISGVVRFVGETWLQGVTLPLFHNVTTITALLLLTEFLSTLSTTTRPIVTAVYFCHVLELKDIPAEIRTTHLPNTSLELLSLREFVFPFWFRCFRNEHLELTCIKRQIRSEDTKCVINVRFKVYSQHKLSPEINQDLNSTLLRLNENFLPRRRLLRVYVTSHGRHCCRYSCKLQHAGELGIIELLSCGFSAATALSFRLVTESTSSGQQS